MILMKAVVFQFITHINQNKQEAGNTDGQPNDIKQGIIEMFQEVPD